VPTINTPSGGGGAGGSSVSAAAPYLTVGGSRFGPADALTLPPTADWTWDNQSTCTISSATGALVLVQPAAAASGVHGYYRTAPAAPFTLTALFEWMPQPGTNNPAGGIMARQASDGKILTYYLQPSGSTAVNAIGAARWTNSTTFSASEVANVNFVPASRAWLRYADDNTNRVLSWSTDGITFQQFNSVTRSTFATFDQIGLFVSGTTLASITLYSWAVA
jgi:hypothetical protein